jgi:hypothetical protein
MEYLQAGMLRPALCPKAIHGAALAAALVSALLGCTPERAPVSVVIDAPPPATDDDPSASAHERSHTLPSAHAGACLPKGEFDESAMWQALPPHDPHGPMEVLVWQRISDDRPWALDTAVVWFRYTQDDGSAGYKLAHLVRNPHLPAPEGTTWRLARVYDAMRFRAADNYDHPPTGPEIQGFLRDTQWESAPPGWTLLGEGLCRETWKRVTGSAPPPGL